MDKSLINELIVLANQTKLLPASVYRFRNIIIEQGGHLLIQEDSQDWCILHSDKDVIIHGKITYRNMGSGLGKIIATTPLNRTIDYEFREKNKGGKGGDGETASTSYSQPSGRGSLGSNNFGGGGGGGTGYQHMPRGDSFKGSDAIEQYGGGTTFFGGGAGGNGGERGNTNGGIIYIYSTGDLDGSGGIIDVSGSKGIDGNNGVHGTHNAGSGGGGGGAPGGEGGYCIFEVKGEFIARPAVETNGGEGGNGGIGGSSFRGSGPGLPGTKGLSGKVVNL